MSKVTVFTARKLDNLTTDKIKTKIQEKENNKNLEIEFIVDESLIGGIIIKKNDMIFDGSVVKELEDIKKHLSR